MKDIFNIEDYDEAIREIAKTGYAVSTDVFNSEQTKKEFLEHFDKQMRKNLNKWRRQGY